MALAVLRGLGHERIIACDVDDAKLAAARARGAKETCNLKSEGLKRLNEIAAGALYGMLDFVGIGAQKAGTTSRVMALSRICQWVTTSWVSVSTAAGTDKAVNVRPNQLLDAPSRMAFIC